MKFRHFLSARTTAQRYSTRVPNKKSFDFIARLSLSKFFCNRISSHKVYRYPFKKTTAKYIAGLFRMSRRLQSPPTPCTFKKPKLRSKWTNLAESTNHGCKILETHTCENKDIFSIGLRLLPRALSNISHRSLAIKNRSPHIAVFAFKISHPCEFLFWRAFACPSLILYFIPPSHPYFPFHRVVFTKTTPMK
jgi:hypothetical protein